MKRTNLKQTQIRVIKADLIEQDIIREVMIGKSKKYEFIPNSQPLDTKAFEKLRNAKLKDLEYMLRYVETTESRMKFLCNYLGCCFGIKGATDGPFPMSCVTITRPAILIVGSAAALSSMRDFSISAKVWVIASLNVRDTITRWCLA